MLKPGDWVRWLLCPRLAVFATQVRSGDSLATMVAVRLTTTTERVLRAVFALCGVAAVGLGQFLWTDSAFTVVAFGLVAVPGAAWTLRTTTTMADACLARAAIRAALTEGREHSAQHWRIDGPAAEDVGRELIRLQNLWLPGQTAESGELDRARATMIANEANARITPYLGELTVAEHQAWLATPASAELPEEEPHHRAEYHRDGDAWPSLDASGSSPTWPTLRDRELPLRFRGRWPAFRPAPAPRQRRWEGRTRPSP